MLFGLPVLTWGFIFLLVLRILRRCRTIDTIIMGVPVAQFEIPKKHMVPDYIHIISTAHQGIGVKLCREARF